MKVNSKKVPSFKKEGLQIQPPFPNLPFMFSVGLTDTQPSTSSSDRKTSEKKSEKIKSSFKSELEKLGISAKLIPEKNPLKENRSGNNSPNRGLPYQRRARSSSPPKEELKVENKTNYMFAPRSPVIVSHKLVFREEFLGFCKESGYSEVEEDEDLKNLKEEYRKMLEGANIEYCSESSDDVGDEGEIENMEMEIGISKRRYF